MKRLNLNNSNAMETMQRKTNTAMKNNTNIFAKVFFLVVMMVTLLPNTAWGQAWTQDDNGKWYIFNQTYTTPNSGTNWLPYYAPDYTLSSTIYSPVSTTGTMTYNAKKSKAVGISGKVRFFIDCGETTYSDQSYQETYNNVSKNFSVPSGNLNIQYGWESSPSHTLGEKKITVQIAVPVHCDSKTFSNKTFAPVSVLESGKTSDITINTSDLFTSFLTANTSSGKITFEISKVDGDDAAGTKTFYIGSETGEMTTPYQLCGANAAFQPTDAHDVPTSITFHFKPKYAGTKTATVYVKKDGTQIGTFTLTGECTKGTPEITWIEPEYRYLNVGGIVSEPASTNSTGAITFKSLNPAAIVALDNNGNTVEWGTILKAIAPGVATIQTHITETSTYTEGNFQEQFEVSSKIAQIISWTQTDINNIAIPNGGSATYNLNAQACKRDDPATATGRSVSYVSSDPSIASVSGNVLTVLNKGTVTITATAEGDNDYIEAKASRTINIRFIGEQCSPYSVEKIDEITSNQTVPVTGLGGVLTVTVHWDWLATFNGLKITDNLGHTYYDKTLEWYQAEASTNGHNETHTYSLGSGVTSLTFSGIGDNRWFRNISVTQQTYFTPENKTSMDFGNVTTNNQSANPQTFYIDYSNLTDPIDVTLSGGANSNFTIDNDFVNVGCYDYGRANFNIKFAPKSKGEHTETITFTSKMGNTSQTHTITVRGNGTGQQQSLSWQNPSTFFANLNALTTVNNDNIDLTFAAKSDAYEIDQTVIAEYELFDLSIPNMVEIVNSDGKQYLKINKAGTFKIRAKQIGNDTYDAAKTIEYGPITVSLVTPNLGITGNTAPDLYTKFPVSASSTGSSAEGYSLASNGKITFSIDPAANLNATITNYSEANKSCDVTVNSRVTDAGFPVKIVAHLAATDIYEARTETLTVNAQKVNPIIVWANTSAELSGTQKVGDVVQLNAIIWQNSSYKVTYQSSNTSLATVDNNTGKMTCVAPGIVKITATFTENADLKASTPEENISYLFLISPADFGNVQILDNKTIPFLISTGESSTFDISLTDMSGFFIRCSNTDDWVTSLTNVSDGSTVYVKFQPNAATSFDKTSAVTHNSKTYNCNLKGTGTAYTHTFDANVKPVTASSYHPWNWQSLPADFLKNSSSTYTVEIDNSVSGNDAEFLVQANVTADERHARSRSGLHINEPFRVAFFPTSSKSQFGCTVQIYDSEYPDIKYPITISANGITDDIKTFTADLTHNGEAEEMEISTRYFRPSSGNGNFTITATEHFLLRKNGEASWAKVITGVKNDDKFYVYFAPTRNEQGEKVCTLTVRDNDPIYNPQDNEYKVIVKGTPATEQTYTFTENIPVMGLSTQSFKHELKNFKPSGDLTIDASNTNYMVSKTENGTYAQTITLTQSDAKEFHIKFAPTEGGEHPAYIKVSDVVSTASGTETMEYYVRASGTTSNRDFDSVNIGQASTAMTFSLESLKDRGATSFTITPSNPYVFRAFTDNESSYSSATTQGAIEVTEGNRFNVKFYPETEGETTETITVVTDNDIIISIAVKGTGVRQSFNFGNAILGHTSEHSQTVTLQNMVPASNYTVTSNKSAVFRINEQTEAVTLSGNESFNIRFYPQAATTYNDNNTYFITIRDNSTNKDYRIYCSGTGSGQQNIDFGSVAFSEGSSPVNVSISGYPASGFKLKVDDYHNFWINGQPMQNGADITSTGENTFSISFHPQTTGNVTDKIYVTDGTNKYDVVNVTGNGTKKDVTLNWVDNDKLNVDDVESHLATTGTFDDYITVTYTSNNPSVLYVDNDNPSQAIAMGAGTATLDATIDDTKGQNRYFNFTNSSSFPISKTFTVTEERILVIVPGTNIKRLGNLKENAGSITLDATVQFKDGTAYEAHPTPDYSLTENDGCVTLSGNTLTVVQAGTAKLQMSVSGDPANEIVGNTLTYNIFVTEIGDCSHTELEINNFEFTDQSIKGLEQILQIQKKNGVLPPMRKLTFHWKVTGRAPQYTFDVREKNTSGDKLMNQISQNYNIWEGNKTDEGNVEIDLTNNQLENICFEFHSTFKFGEELSTSKASITDVHVYQKSYFSKAASEPSSLNFGTSEYGKSVQLPLKFDYSAISPLTFEIVSGDDCFSISDSELEDVTDCSDFGQKSVNVVFTPKKVGHCEATIKITAHTIDGDVSFTYDVTGEGIKRKQIINNWSEDVTLPIIFRYENISIGNDPGDTYKPANPQYSVSGKSIVYTSDNEEVLTVDQNGEGGKWLIHVISQGDANITAHIDGDDNTTACDATRKFTVQKGNQTIVWDSWDATNGKTIKTNCNTTDRDILLDAKTQDVAGHDIPTDEIEFTYTIQQTTPCDQTHTTLAEIVKCTDGKQYLRYNGYGAGDVVVSVSAAESKNYYAATNNGSLTRKLHIVRTPSSEYKIENTTRNPNDLTYGDLATLSSDVTFNGNPHYNLKEKTEYQYTSSAETVAKVVNTNQLQIQSVGSFDLTTNVIQNCYMESKNTSIQLSTSKSSQKIISKDIPAQATFNQGSTISIDLNNYFYTVDTRHSSGLPDYGNIPTYLTKNEKDEVMANTTLTYNVTFTKDDNTCLDFATFDGDHTITINGSAAGEISVTASQAGDDNYDAAANVTKTFRVDRITPTVTVTGPAGTFDYDTDPHTLTASSTGTNYSSANDNDATFTYDVVEGNDVASISGTQLTILKAGTVKVTATQEANCIVNSATSEEYTITINHADPQLAWNVEPQDATYNPANNTQSLSVTTNSDADPEFSVTPTDGATIDAQSGVLTITKVGTYKVTVTLVETDKYNSASIEKTIVISKADADFFSIANITMTYNDAAVSLNNDISGGNLTLGTDYQVSYSVGDNGNGYFAVDDANKTISPLNANVDNSGNLVEMTLNASITGMTNYNDKQITGKVYVQKATQTIVWSGIQTTYDTWNVGEEKTITLDDFTQSKDVSHDNAVITPDLTKTYELEISNKGCDIEDAAVAYIENNVLHITGAASATLTIYAKQDGTDDKGENYTKVEKADNCTTVITINKMTPTVTLYAITGTIQFGDEVSLHATASGTGYADDSSNSGTKIKFKYNGTEITGNTFTVDDADGKFTVQAYMDGDCQINSTVSSEAEYDIALTAQEIVWNQSEMESSYTTLDNNQITLNAYAIDAVHKTPEIKTGATIEYELVLTPDNNACSEIATLQNGVLTLTGAGSGTVTVKATCQEVAGKYSAVETPVEKSFTITKAAPQFNWTDENNITATYGDQNVNAGGITKDGNGTVSYSSDDEDVATIDGNGNITIVGAGTTTISATLAADCKYAEVTTPITKTLTVNRATGTINWASGKEPQNATFDTGNNSQQIKATTTSNGNITYSVESTEGAQIDAQTGVLTITKAGIYTVTATVAETSQYNSASINKTITISKGIPTLTISGKTPMECYTTQNLTPTTNNDETPSITYTSSDNNIIEVDGTGAVTAKSMGNATITATLSETTSWKSTTTNITIQVTNGTLHFVTEGNWNDQTKWSPVHKLPTSSDNVLIEANCTLNMTAECRDMEIGSGTLTISTAGILNVANTLSNSDASKLVIAADATGQGTLIFHNSTDTDMPQATVEMWCKGSKAGTAEGGGNINPNWQYRGIAVSSATFTDENAPDLIYQWSETAQTNNEITEQWTKVTGNAMSAWNGYAVAKYTDAEGHGYKTSAAGELTNADKVINLAYTANQTPEDQTPEGVQSGFNLITNSYTAPLNFSKLEYGNEIQKGVVLFNTGKYIDWKNSDNKQIGGDNNVPGQYLFLPKNTGQEIASDVIPSGESFFVVTSAADKSITIPYAAVEQQTSGALRMPGRREIYNKLIIEVDGGEGADRLYLLENENRIRGFENGYDGPKYAGTKGNPMLYATTDDGRLSVSADSSLLGQYIGFAAGKHDVTYTISFDASALSGYSELYLYDTREKRYTNILDGGTYTFKGLVSGEDKRFKIVGSRRDGESVTGDEQMIIVTGNRFHVSGYDNTDERIYLVDMTGKILWETTTAFGPWFDIPTDIPAGVYVIKTGNHTAKIAVK